MIKIEHLTVKTKQQNTLLHDVSVQFDDGKVHGIIGPNGSGKTSLLRTICQLNRSTAGSISLDDQNIAELSTLALASRLSWTESEHPTPFAYPVRDIILWGRWSQHQGLPKPDDHHHCQNAAERLKISALLDRPLTTLSLGEKKKVHLAKSLASGVKHLIWDEPCAPLDIRASLDVLEIAKSCAEAGQNVIVTLHDLSLVERYCDTVTILKNGHVTWQGSPSSSAFINQIESTFDVSFRQLARTGAPQPY